MTLAKAFTSHRGEIENTFNLQTTHAYRMHVSEEAEAVELVLRRKTDEIIMVTHEILSRNVT